MWLPFLITFYFMKQIINSMSKQHMNRLLQHLYIYTKEETKKKSRSYYRSIYYNYIIHQKTKETEREGPKLNKRGSTSPSVGETNKKDTTIIPVVVEQSALRKKSSTRKRLTGAGFIKASNGFFFFSCKPFPGRQDPQELSLMKKSCPSTK